MKKSNKNEKQKNFRISGYDGESLAYLIKRLKAAGYTENDFVNTEFELDYDCCYYEGDVPSIKLIIKG